MIKPERIKKIIRSKESEGKVIYWMSRDQRFRDNWGLIFADQLRKEHNTEMAVVFCLADTFLQATERQYNFMLEGLEELYTELYEKNIPFYLLRGNPVDELKKFIKEFDIKHLVYDFDPLRIKQSWQSGLTGSLNINFYEVDSHNIVPARKASDKREFGAYTLRPKIHKQLEYFLDEFPEIRKRAKTKEFQLQKIDFKKTLSFLDIERNVKAVSWIKPGEKEAKKTLHHFMEKKLENYSDKKNDPNSDVLSNLSPYLHFGQISAQRVALEILKLTDKNENIDSFIEELIVRKELADNYCLYNKNYDNLDDIPEWAEKTIRKHDQDEREYCYSSEEFEKSGTHEDLWN
ncbi:MAG: deoxyribodipyrimidine photo-lyase, partial [Bacteroidota bacterium]